MKRIAFFGEDSAHEAFARALISRLTQEHGVDAEVSIESAIGGHGKAISELIAFQRRLSIIPGVPDLVVIMIDGNCQGWNTKRLEIEKVLDSASVPAHVIGCPDPHIERWYMSDAKSGRALGLKFSVGATKCERGYYKRCLEQAITDAGIVPTLGGAEWAADLVAGMNLSRITEPSLKNFIGALTSAIKRLR